MPNYQVIYGSHRLADMPGFVYGDQAQAGEEAANATDGDGVSYVIETDAPVNYDQQEGTG